MKPFLHRYESDEESGTFRPQLTSLIDVMTILLVFLIKSFSVEGHLITPSADLELPVSSSETPPRAACVLEITKDAVISEGTILATVESIENTDSLVVPSLLEFMRLQRAKCSDTSSAEVIIQSDKNMEFVVVKRVMYTCSKAGFADFSVLVLEEE